MVHKVLNFELHRPAFFIKLLGFLFAFFALTSINFAQSGRVKPTPTPSPTTTRPKIVTPQIDLRDIRPAKPAPTPTTTTVSQKEDDDVIKITSTLVPIPVSVLDKQGRAVSSLKTEDFQLQIDGKEQEVTEVFRSNTPVRLALLFDNSSSVIQAIDFEKKAAIRFFRQVIRPEKDLAALFSVATVTRLEQPLTQNVSQLVQAIENFAKPAGATSLFDGIIQAANYLQDHQGRRVIVIVSDGEDTLSDASLETTLKTVQAANCQIYVVKTTEFENFKRTGERQSNANVRALTAERRMQQIAKETGGVVYSPIDEKELSQAFTDISAELSEQYILSYYPEELGERGQFREISLKIKDQPNLIIRTRKGYYVPKR